MQESSTERTGIAASKVEVAPTKQNAKLTEKPKQAIPKETIEKIQKELHALKTQFQKVVDVTYGNPITGSETMMCMYDSKGVNMLDIIRKINAWCSMIDAEMDFWYLTADMDVVEMRQYYEFVMAANMIKHGKMSLRFLEPGEK